MSVVNFDLRTDWLRRHEVGTPELREQFRKIPVVPGVPRGQRCFKVAVGGERYVLAIRHAPASSAEAFSMPEEDPEEPSDAVLLLLIAQAFLGSLPPFPPVEADVEAGWETYRREQLEAGVSFTVPTWGQLLPQEREAFAAGIAAAAKGSAVPAAKPQREICP